VRQHLLEHAEPVLGSGNLVKFMADLVEDLFELRPVLLQKSCDDHLEHVVAHLVFSEPQYSVLAQLLDYLSKLAVVFELLDQVLQRVGSLAVERDVEEIVALNELEDVYSLRRLHILDELADEVVAVLVIDQVNQVFFDLLHQSVDELFV